MTFIVYSLPVYLADLNWPEEQFTAIRDLCFPVDREPKCNNIFLFGWQMSISWDYNI